LAKPGEIGQRWPAAKQISGHPDMRLECCKNPTVALLEQRPVFGRRAKNGHARNLPLTELLDLFKAADLRIRS
jgi:hypothetical protein